MDWSKNYEAIMRDAGHKPYGCVVEGCGHVSRGTFGQIAHHLFGVHDDPR